MILLQMDKTTTKTIIIIKEEQIENEKMTCVGGGIKTTTKRLDCRT